MQFISFKFLNPPEVTPMWKTLQIKTAGNRPDFTPINFLWHSTIDLSSGLFLNRQKRFYEVGRRAKMQETKYANARSVLRRHGDG